MSFPAERPRRLRRSEALRNLVRETWLTTQGLVYPMFVCPGSKVRTEVSSMPGVYQQSVDQLVEECREVESLGVPGVILFGLPKNKDARGSEAVSASGVVQRAIEGIRKAKLKLLVITDVCLCEYTDHGHCGVLQDGVVLNDPTLEIEEGADMVMVKPALPYLDIVRLVRDGVQIPVAAYNVSGEYAMVKAAARNGWLDEQRVVLEILTAIKRAGADIVLTYHAKDAARWLKAC